MTTFTQTYEIKDAIRIPLYELQADIDYLIGRVASDGSCANMISSSIKTKLAAIEKAIREDD